VKKLKKWFANYKLNQKFTIVIIIFVLLPIAAFSFFMFTSMEKNVINERMESMTYRMEKSHNAIIKNIDAINMSTQFFLSDIGLNNYLKAVGQGEAIAPTDLMSFYNQNITLLERMVNNNPDLYQIRVYVDSPDMQEMMPILYREERMRQLAWAAIGDGSDGEESLAGWKFDYYDTLFNAATINRDKKIMSSVVEMHDYQMGQLGILEVAMYMETMFPLIYEPEQNTYSCFIDQDNHQYFNESDGQFLPNYLLEPAIGQALATGEATVFYHRIDQQPMVIGIRPVKELEGVLVCFDSLDLEMDNVSRLRIIFIFIVMIVMAVLVVMIDYIVKGLLKRFYLILNSIREVQKGDLEVVITDCGTDEMGELGTQINTMLRRIKQLMDDNINREILARDSEIRALQNQINAHFIYNVLESIKMMAEIDEKYEISDAITALGKLLRYSMHWSEDYVSVEEELEYIRNYLQLINLRFDYEITLAVSLPDNIRIQKIPKMSLQPIIENAIYHGIEQLAEDTSIYLKGFVEAGDCLIEITDMGRGMSEEEVARLYLKINGEIETSGGAGNGIGLKNVQDRIKMGYGDEYGINIVSRKDIYTKIIIRIPLNGSSGP
jgi:two-component system sensor histidine kinase YesM